MAYKETRSISCDLCEAVFFDRNNDKTQVAMEMTLHNSDQWLVVVGTGEKRLHICRKCCKKVVAAIQNFLNSK